ncbi:Hypothetical predicted protein, partial [Mytilus galloprovincialis]
PEYRKPHNNKDTSQQDFLFDLTNLLKTTERTFHVKMWHDHSDILNHTYISFMASLIYDSANFLTNEELQITRPMQSKLNAQTIVERPNLYIFGQSASTDKEQITYVTTRCEDIENLSPITLNGIDLNIKLRIFSGDNPARQFEAGQQRGGNYACICSIETKDQINLMSCFKKRIRSLEDRRKLVVQGEAWKELEKGNLNPFQNMLKQNLEYELEIRQINTSNMNRTEMKDKLQETLSGIARPPALSIENPLASLKNKNLEKYEVFGCEPLHDIAGMVKNLIEELPSHIEDKKIKSEYETFSKDTIGDRNQIKGSDARLFAVKLAKFTLIKKNEGKLPGEFVQLITSLVDIINIAYSGYEQRSPRQLLRLYNQTFLFGTLCKKVIGNPVKMTNRKFYGAHFHSISTHLAELYRIINTKSVLTEQEERSFGDLRRISAGTSNRKPGWIVDNAVIRFMAQQNTSNRVNSFVHQDSTIKRQASLLTKQPDTILEYHTFKDSPMLFQSHMERIADFLEHGENVWWHLEGSDVIFHDSSTQPESRIQGPFLHHFRSSSLISAIETVDETWIRIIDKFEKNIIKLPMTKVKTYEEGKPQWVTPRPNTVYEQHSTDDDNTSECTIQLTGYGQISKEVIHPDVTTPPYNVEMFQSDHGSFALKKDQHNKREETTSLHKNESCVKTTEDEGDIKKIEWNSTNDNEAVLIKPSSESTTTNDQEEADLGYLYNI